MLKSNSSYLPVKLETDKAQALFDQSKGTFHNKDLLMELLNAKQAPIEDKGERMKAMRSSFGSAHKRAGKQ